MSKETLMHAYCAIFYNIQENGDLASVSDAQDKLFEKLCCKLGESSFEQNLDQQLSALDEITKLLKETGVLDEDN